MLLLVVILVKTYQCYNLSSIPCFLRHGIVHHSSVKMAAISLISKDCDIFVSVSESRIKFNSCGIIVTGKLVITLNRNDNNQ